MIVGICGGSGSGKTTLLNQLSEEFKDFNPTIFSMDNYYLPIEKQCKDEKGEYNFDLPDALDREKLEKDLQSLMEGQSIKVKEYFFNAPPDAQVYKTLEPSPLIIVEGIFLFHYLEIKSKLDYSVFIEIDPEIQLERRMKRDLDTRGYSEEAILYQWNNHVLPCYHTYLTPYKPEAHFCFRSDENCEQDFILLREYLMEKLKLQEMA
jgi:uridine kinase